MPTVHNITIPNDTESPNQLQFANGFDQFGGAGAEVVIPVAGFPGTSVVLVNYINAPLGANSGVLAATYDPATDQIKVTSSNALDANLFVWAIFG